ncbi:hypothetical protein MKK64_11865 [Methylobacterium sp. E-025]|uniref:hypothetical protein n=1 Tax=Methylobacterium sp. E-025 TaxID=2836561 RepID=UPI001FBC0044|nr:hypothetical protein [Methylobacterium sp. E-025]MCJ2111893.1 hypothetical protein [Methylobacterium sp. E-025]
MKVFEIWDYPFNIVDLDWHGPFEWPKGSGNLKLPEDLGKRKGIYRAEYKNNTRRVIKYIGSASEGFSKRLTSRHRIYSELVTEGHFKIQIYAAPIVPERKITLSRSNYVEIEYIMAQVHWKDLISWHGISKLPKIRRGEGWRIISKGRRGHISRVIAYPAFAVAGQNRG